MRAALSAATVTGALMMGQLAAPAAADDGGPRVVGGRADRGYEVTATDPGSSGSSSSGGSTGGGGSVVDTEPAVGGGGSDSGPPSLTEAFACSGSYEAPPAGSPSGGRAPPAPVSRCVTPGGGGGSGGPAGQVPEVSPAELARRATQRLSLPAPEVRTAPPHEGRRMDGLVGLPEWFWLPRGQQGPVSERVTAGSVWAEATVRPQRLVIDPGEGLAAVSCPGLGTAYERGMAPTASGCSYTYRQSSAARPGDAHRVTATVVWGGSWTGSGGAGGELPELSRATTLRLRIGEAQALVTNVRVR